MPIEPKRAERSQPAGIASLGMNMFRTLIATPAVVVSMSRLLTELIADRVSSIAVAGRDYAAAAAELLFWAMNRLFESRRCRYWLSGWQPLRQTFHYIY